MVEGVTEKYAYLKLSSKSRRNEVDFDNSSKELIEKTINHDRLYGS
jgi:hypothetical protein